MYTGLQNKLYYFLTDRETNYHYFIDNSNSKQPKKYLYYPEEYQKMTQNRIQKYRKSMVIKFIKWSLQNQQKLQFNDKKIINSIMINSLIIMGVCAFGAKAFRKILFRTQLPVLEIRLERLGFNIRILKTLISYVAFTTMGYKFIRRELQSTYLVDLAFEYKNNFAQRMHSKVDDLIEKLSQERLNRKKIQQQSI